MFRYPTQSLYKSWPIEWPKIGGGSKNTNDKRIMATKNQIIDSDTATLIVEEFGHKPIRVSESDIEDSIVKYDENYEGDKSQDHHNYYYGPC